jgi:hypothetical protein
VNVKQAYFEENVLEILHLLRGFKVGLKRGISHQLGRDAVVRFECENSAIDVIINYL